MLIGYMRVSTGEQSLDLQRDALERAGCERVYEDVCSGRATERPGLAQALEVACDGDALAVWKLDRIGRSLPHVVGLVGDLQKRGVGLKVLTGDVDTTPATGRLVFGIFATVAEFERDLIHERTMVGLAAARARARARGRGRAGERPRVMTKQKLKAAMAMMADRDNAARDVAKQLGVSVSTLYAYVDAKVSRGTWPLRSWARVPAQARDLASMPVGFLSDEQASQYGRFVGDPTPDQLARHFHLDDADRAFVGEHRGDHSRLGVAVQLGSIRLLGTFLEDPGLTLASVVRFAGDQLAMAGSAEVMAIYVASVGRWRHGPRIRKQYGYRPLTDYGVAFRLHRFLYALCWTGTDRPSALFERAVAWLQATKVILPGISVLERAVARVRARTHAYLHRRLTETLTTEQRERLDRLVTVPKNERQSPFDRLRDRPYVQNGPEISRTIARLIEIRALADGLPELDRVPPGKAAALARFASVARAQAVSRLQDDRHASTLVAFIRMLEASASDDVIDLVRRGIDNHVRACSGYVARSTDAVAA